MEKKIAPCRWLLSVTTKVVKKVPQIARERAAMRVHARGTWDSNQRCNEHHQSARGTRFTRIKTIRPTK